MCRFFFKEYRFKLSVDLLCLHTVYLQCKYFKGIAAVTAVDDDVESLTVSEGGNLTISIHIKKWAEDPQVLVSRLKGSSQQLIAQITCHDRVCERECMISGVSLISDEENVTLILMNVSFSQSGLYKVCKLGDTQPQNKIFQVTVFSKY